MRILWINSSGWLEGGAEHNIVSLRPLIERQGHTVKIFASNDRPDKKHFSDYTYPAHRGLLRFFFHVCNVSAYLKLKKILRDFKPDIVHVHTIGHGSPLLFFALRDIPTLLTLHGPEAFLKSLLVWCFPAHYFHGNVQDMRKLKLIGKIRLLYHRLFLDPVYAHALRNIDVSIAPSRYMQAVAKQEGLTSAYLPNGAELFNYEPLDISQPNHTVAYVGRLEAYKGVDFLLRAMPMILIKFSDAKILIAGDGAEKDSLARLVQELDIEHAVKFLGMLDRDALQHLYAQASAVVVPSVVDEAFGLVGIEAMSVGRPVIATDVGGVSDWLDNGVTGLLVSKKNSKKLAQAVLSLFENPETALSMSQHARKKAELFSLESHTVQLLALYRQLDARKERGSA